MTNKLKKGNQLSKNVLLKPYECILLFFLSITRIESIPRLSLIHI